MDKHETVLIAGAGLAGSQLSVDLASLGYEVEVVEKRPEQVSSEGGRSINLALSARGLNALHRIDLSDSARSISLPMSGRMMHDTHGKQSFQPYSADSHSAILSISRSQLNAMLLERARQEERVSFKFSSECVDVNWQTRDVHVRTGDSIELRRPSRVVGCDGAGSQIRQSMEAAGLVSVDADLLPHGYKELTIQPDSGGDFALDPNALHIWPRGGFMLIALPNNDKTFTATLFMPQKGSSGFDNFSTTAKWTEFFEREFGDALQLMQRFESEITQNPVGILGTVRCNTWHVSDFGLLMGDAAHAIVPFFGQGMNASLEDCTFLVRFLKSGLSWSEAALEMSTSRRIDTNAIADMALENYVEMRDSIADPSFQRRRLFELAFEKMLAPEYQSRYSMVSFTNIPYARTVEIAELQSAIVDELQRSHSSPDSITATEWEAVRERIVQTRKSRV